MSQQNKDGEDSQQISALAGAERPVRQPIEQFSSQEVEAFRQFFDLLAVWDEVYSEKVRDD